MNPSVIYYNNLKDKKPKPQDKSKCTSQYFIKEKYIKKYLAGLPS